MEVEISPAASFNANHQNIMHGAATQNGLNGLNGLNGESAAKRFKTDLQFRCIECNDAYGDPNTLYEHMRGKHPELYERTDVDDDEDDQMSTTSDDFGDYSSILEPICELRQDDDEELLNLTPQMNAEPKKDFNDPHLQLQLQLQNHIQNQLQMHNFLQALANQGITNEKANEAIAYVLRSLGLRKSYTY